MEFAEIPSFRFDSFRTISDSFIKLGMCMEPIEYYHFCTSYRSHRSHVHGHVHGHMCMEPMCTVTCAWSPSSTTTFVHRSGHVTFKRSPNGGICRNSIGNVQTMTDRFMKLGLCIEFVEYYNFCTKHVVRFRSHDLPEVTRS